MKTNIRNGTRPVGPILCHTCRHCTSMKGAAESQEVIHCSIISEFLKFPVVECSDYYSRNEKTMYDYEQMAWILFTKKAGREVGFMRSADFRKEFKESVLPGDAPPY